MAKSSSLEHALRLVREFEMWEMPHRDRFVRKNRDLFGDLSTRLLSDAGSGVMGDCANTENQIPRTRGLPRNENDPSGTLLIQENCGKTWRATVFSNALQQRLI